MSPNAGGGVGGLRVSANEYSCAHGAQINFGDLTPWSIVNLWVIVMDIEGGIFYFILLAVYKKQEKTF
jgi:hypothetical protein